MKFVENEIFHVYNRGNQKQPIFFNRGNYLYFLQKVRYHLFPICDILAYCLMPNHFHFFIKTNEKTVALRSGDLCNKKLIRKEWSLNLTSIQEMMGAQIPIIENPGIF